MDAIATIFFLIGYNETKSGRLSDDQKKISLDNHLIFNNIGNRMFIKKKKINR